MKGMVLKALWWKEGIALSRDLHGLAALFIMPAVFILVMSLALRDTLKPDGSGPRLGYAVVDLDRTPTSRELAELLAGAHFQEAPGCTTEAEARSAIAAGRLPFAVIIPRGFEEHALDPGRQLELRLDPTIAILARSAFRQRLEAALGLLKTRRFLRATGGVFGEEAAASVNAEGLRDAIGEEAVGGPEGARPPSAIQQNVPAWLIFGMFFVVIPISTIFINERHHGTLQRLRGMGIDHGEMLLGKLLPFVGINLIQTVLMVAVGIWVVPLFGGESLALPRTVWLPFGGMALAVSLAAVSWALLVASFGRTTEQATILGGVGNILMGALGGIFVPRFVMPAGMRPLTHVSPMAWGLEGFHQVMLRGSGWRGMLPSSLRLLAFALAALALGAVLARRRNRQP